MEHSCRVIKDSPVLFVKKDSGFSIDIEIVLSLIEGMVIHLSKTSCEKMKFYKLCPMDGVKLRSVK